MFLSVFVHIKGFQFLVLVDFVLLTIPLDNYQILDMHLNMLMCYVYKKHKMLKTYGITFTNNYKYLMKGDTPKTLLQIANAQFIIFILMNFFEIHY